MHLIDNFRKIEAGKPVDTIIKQIKKLLVSGQLKPGDRLPAERKLAEKFGVGRTHVHDAIKKLEFIGILKTLPQSGSIVTNLDVSALELPVSDVLELLSVRFCADTLLLVAIKKQDTELTEKIMRTHLDAVMEFFKPADTSCAMT